MKIKNLEKALKGVKTGFQHLKKYKKKSSHTYTSNSFSRLAKSIFLAKAVVCAILNRVEFKLNPIDEYNELALAK